MPTQEDIYCESLQKIEEIFDQTLNNINNMVYKDLKNQCMNDLEKIIY